MDEWLSLMKHADHIPTIGLCMIVKNETAVIESCLDSLRSLVDYELIEDTGSTDGTRQFIRAWLARNKMPSEVIEEPWRDFAYNRSCCNDRWSRTPMICPTERAPE
ncbi:hypothetical protein K9U39_01085 [Rhodoblastus acidophilus]|uniref:Glycosyltransferase 2-like domain-containing protein n=1 Tax=Candidatus Rhodoblastus alkanivorans TaxID=2954117 RepID=A0ABS9Z4Y7_9HYPH|nr:glycosyltransferase [Candidatus Rhodoblastus alkanivorans]MCI4680521.1 hypothetical protein [Candidatus Rhodoblastus alkanivorans]MCI4682247.1 hypothetical protein [Candidatus Rhodoblastus alkanivorans]MDI4639549.1 hypothetical protein [Rhodoblastus acidophilus]